MFRDEVITRVFGSLYELCEATAQQIVNEAAKAMYTKGNFSLVLSGGTTPRKVYQFLSTLHRDEIDWEHTFLVFGDERLVPPDHAESNYRMVKETLLDHISIPEANVLRINMDAENPCEDYARRIREVFALRNGEFPKFDMTLLGMGEDGHTASLFPKSPALQERESIAISVHAAGAAISDRVSLTLPAFNNSRMIIFLINGTNKAKVVADVFDNPDCNYPAKNIKPLDGELYWFLDLEASALLTSIV